MRRARREREIAPDEIFLDAANVSQFDRSRLEGRLEKPLSRGTFAGLGATLAIFALILIAQAGNLEIRQGTAFAAESAKNSLESTTIFAERGIITDRNGVLLATNQAQANGYDERVYKEPGFGALLGYVSYPKKDTNGNYYDTEETGVAGVESKFNAQLAGENGTLLVEKNALGAVASQGSVVPAQNGRTLALSIDARAQEAMYAAVKDVSDSVGFIGGAGVLMNVNTGEVEALVSYPEYDPNVLSAGAPAATIAGYSTNPGRPYLDRAVQGLYTPGSVVKPIEAAGALTDGVITPQTTIDDTGSISIPNPYDASEPNIFVDWKAIGVEDVEKAIAWSSDVFFYSVGGGYAPFGIKGLGIDRLDYWYQTFGLTSPTGIQLPGEITGFVPTPAWKQATFGQAWNIGDTYHTAIGQYAMQVTPIALARAISAVANGGKLVEPTLLANQPVKETTLPVSPAALATARAGMREGVTSALSLPLNLPYVDVAAKTGTAQVGVNNQLDNAWVEGFWPYEDPEYAFVVVLERGPVGAGEQGVAVMQQVLDTLHTTAPDYFP